MLIIFGLVIGIITCNVYLEEKIMKNLLLIFMSTFMLIFFSLSALFAEKSELKWIQFQLNKYGYTAGKEDGVWGKATDKAFTLFMKDIGRSFK